MRGRLVVLSTVSAALLAGCTDAPPEPRATYHRDVAPIILENCAPCHRPGEAGPFDLLTYEDARKRGSQIVVMTSGLYMPPWLPMEGHGSFLGERRLTGQELATLEQWLEDGLAEGDPADAPAVPEFAQGWRLGQPDVSFRMGQPYALPAEGQDVIRNFVIPTPVADTHWVAAIELRPGNKRVVHHAVMKVDRTRISRRYAAAEAAPGFSGMRMGNAEDPDGHIIVWTPGSSPPSPIPGMAWRIDARTDLVLQLHMVPSGKPEIVDPEIGLYFASESPTVHPFRMMLREDRIDIPAGERAYRVEDDFTVPVDVRLLAIYPHAHYLGKRMHVRAFDPGGSERWLLRIDDWDFNWQGMYQYTEPVLLPAGTRVAMQYTFDNSEYNTRNPSQPPLRVRGGNRSRDEMATLALQVLPVDPSTMPRLRQAQWEKMVRESPDDPSGHYNLGAEHANQQNWPAAVAHYSEALRLEPSDEGTRFNLGGVYIRQGELELAGEQFHKVLELQPAYFEAHMLLGWIAQRQGDAAAARRHYQQALALQPDLESARKALRGLDSASPAKDR